METIRRAAVVISTCAVLLVLGQGTAWAEGETVVSYSGTPPAFTGINGSTYIKVSASPGGANALKANYCTESVTNVCISDTSTGMTESSPYCDQPDPTVVRCIASGLQLVRINAGDGSDTLGVILYIPGLRVIPTLIKAGAGSDRAFLFGPRDYVGGGPRVLAGGAGTDFLSVKGRGTIKGGANRDTLRGGIGSQRIFGGRGNDYISCGKDKDFARGDHGKDSGGAGCERFL